MKRSIRKTKVKSPATRSMTRMGWASGMESQPGGVSARTRPGMATTANAVAQASDAVDVRTTHLFVMETSQAYHRPVQVSFLCVSVRMAREG
jgi:hypothetical protein